jgi:hypothetical protein
MRRPLPRVPYNPRADRARETYYYGLARARGRNPATPVETPIANDPEVAGVPATTPAPERVTERPRRYSRSDEEREAAEELAVILRPDDSVKRDAEALPFVRQFMSGRDYPFSKRGFLERIWRDARHKAGLDTLGKPGPKNQERIRSAS